FVPANLAPGLDTVADDNPSVYDSGCHNDHTDADPEGCRVGDNPEAPLVFLVGDSHAASWEPALERLAEQGKIRLDSNSKDSCLPREIPQKLREQPYDSCAKWREGLLERIDEEQPDLVLLAMFVNPGRLLDVPETDTSTLGHEGLAATLEEIDGPPGAVLRDVPDRGRSADEGLSMALEDAAACGVARGEAFGENVQRPEGAAIEDAGEDVNGLDFTRYCCNR